MMDRGTLDMFAEYPHSPGWKKRETSAEAAAAVAPRASALRARCLAEVAAAPRGLTGNELAERLGWDICSVRPRLTELDRLGKIRNSGERRKTPSGCSAIVWVVVEGVSE